MGYKRACDSTAVEIMNLKYTNPRDRERDLFSGALHPSIHPSIHPMLFLKDSVEDCGFHCALLWLPFLIFGGLFHVCTLLAAVNVGSE